MGELPQNNQIAPPKGIGPGVAVAGNQVFLGSPSNPFPIQQAAPPAPQPVQQVSSQTPQALQPAPQAPLAAQPLSQGASVPQGAPSYPTTASDGTPLDPGVLKVMGAIRQIESGGDYNASGDNGKSLGAFQWNNGKQALAPGQLPANFVSAAKQFGLDPTDFSPANQNHVAYLQIQDFKNQGLTPIEVDAKWNGANYDSATNTYVHINPARAQTFTQALAQQNNGAAASDPTQIQPETSTQPNSPSFFGNLAQDFSNRGANIAASSDRQAAGQQGFLSTALQDVGQVAGGAGDIFGEALSAADRVLTGGTVGKVLGAGLHAVAQTAPVQAAVGAYDNFAQAHPVAAANIGAVGNIASLIPVGGAGLKGVGLAGDALESAAKSDIIQSAAKGAVNDVRSNLADLFMNSSKSTVADTYQFMKSRGIDPEAILAERKLATEIPIEDGHVRIPDNSPVLASLNSEVASKSTLLDTALSKVKTTVSAEDLKTAVARDIASDSTLRAQGRVPEMQARAAAIVDGYVTQEGKTKFSLTDIQDMKKGQYDLSKKFRKDMNFGPADDHSAVASAMRQAIEDHAPDVSVRKLNRQIGDLQSTIGLLEKLDGATVKGGRLGRYGARILGATIGSQGHIPIISPIIGAFMGDAIVSGLQKAKIAGPINRLLMRVAQVAPDNQVVKDTMDFIQKVETGEKVMPTDDVAEYLARITAKSDIPLLPEAVQREFRSVVQSGPTINLPQQSQSTLEGAAQKNAVAQKGVSEMLNSTKPTDHPLLRAQGENPIPLGPGQQTPPTPQK